MSGVTLKLDGNIDISKLEKDLRSALDFDIKYKQSDNMKKRACKVSADYDEFKAFVACAHLKTVSRAEISNLSEAKRGWQKSNAANKSSSALILSDERRDLEKFGNISQSQEQSIKKPKSPMELDRDLRKAKSVEDKIRYLTKIGLKRVMKLLQTDGNAELLETIIMLLLSVGADDPVTETENKIIKKSNDTTNNHEECLSQIVTPKNENTLDVIEQQPKSLEVLQWLSSFTSLDRFSLMVRFFSKDLISSIVEEFNESVDPKYHNIALKYSI